MSHMVLIELLLKWSNWETTWNPLLGDSQYHRSTLKALKHINLFDYEILQGEFLFSSVGESWETLPYSKPKSTKSYTNKCLVFKGLCLLNGEVPSVFPQTWTLQGESESMHIRCWVWGAGAPLLYISKKGRNLGVQSFELFVCLCLLEWNHLLRFPWSQCSSAWGTHVCWWKLIFDSLKTKLSLTSPTSWRSCRPSVQVRGQDSCDGIHRASPQESRGLGSSPGAVTLGELTME